MSAPLLLLLALLAPGARAGDPVAAAVEKEGLSVVRSVKRGKLTALLLRAGDGSDKLRVYAALHGKAALVYLHPGVEKLELLDAPKGLAGSEPVFLYRAELGGLGRPTLHVLSPRGLRVRSIGRFPDARVEDLDGDGRPEIVSRVLPLGRFFAAECDTFYALADTAYRTDIHSWRKGGFADVSASFPDFYAARISRTERELGAFDRRGRPADYLGASIALYYDYAARGERRLGWERLSELLEPPPFPVPGLAACARRIKEGLRRKLEIPADW